uniref:Uncharacterized protein n=1 Tax=Timema cristinae TaxID=61476 RepID=A0A7R9CR08_TIMCR|nr:unnamed protein product [Timema cristinae]
MAHSGFFISLLMNHQRKFPKIKETNLYCDLCGGLRPFGVLKELTFPSSPTTKRVVGELSFPSILTSKSVLKELPFPSSPTSKRVLGELPFPSSPTTKSVLGQLSSSPTSKSQADPDNRNTQQKEASKNQGFVSSNRINKPWLPGRGQTY